MPSCSVSRPRCQKFNTGWAAPAMLIVPSYSRALSVVSCGATTRQPAPLKAVVVSNCQPPEGVQPVPLLKLSMKGSPLAAAGIGVSVGTGVGVGAIATLLLIA